MSDPVSAGVLIGGAVISKIAAAKLASEREGGKDLALTPTTLSERGSYVPWVVGSHKMGPVFAWAGNRTTRNEKVSSAGKGAGGGAGSETTIFFEEGIHVICLNAGKPRGLRRITRSGERLIEGLITPETSPSGTEIQVKDFGVFQIQWGFLDDEVDEFAGDPDRVGVLSRFPFFIRANWIEGRLGQTANWPALDYVMEMEPVDPTGVLDPEQAWFPGELVQSEDSYKVWSGDGTKLVIRTQVFSIFAGIQIIVEDPANLTGATEEELTFTVLAVTFKELDIDTAPANISTTTVTLDKSLPPGFAGFAQLAGNEFFVRTLTEDETGGANPAHLISMALFAQAPAGIGLDSSEWDLGSLQQLSDQMVAERYKATVAVEQGAILASKLDDLMTDIGCFIVLDDETGLMTFRLLRPGLLREYTVPADAIQGRPIERDQLVSASRFSKVYYTFRDRQQNFRDQPIHLGDDGIVRLGALASGKTVRINSTTDYDTAEREAIRREMEAFGDTSKYKLKIGFEGRNIRPADVLRIQDLPPLLVYSTKLTDDETGGEHEATTNFYLAPETDFSLPVQAGEVGDPTELAILQSELWILPSALKDSSLPVSAALLWTRSSGAVSNAVMFLSTDNVGYSAQQSGTNYCTGGDLIDLLPLSDLQGTPLAAESLDPRSPLMEFTDEDIGLLQDLSGSPSAFEAGQQLLYMNGEVMLLERAEFTIGNQARLIGLRRGMYGTPVLNHFSGSKVFIFPSNNWTEFSNPSFLSPGQQVWVKVQPLGSGIVPGLEDIDFQTLTP